MDKYEGERDEKMRVDYLVPIAGAFSFPGSAGSGTIFYNADHPASLFQKNGRYISVRDTPAGKWPIFTDDPSSVKVEDLRLVRSIRHLDYLMDEELLTLDPEFYSCIMRKDVH